MSKFTIPLSFSWSIQPLVIWLRILGIDLIPDVSRGSSSSTRLKRWTMYSYGTLCFLCHLFWQIDILYFLHVHRVRVSFEIIGGSDTVTSLWNVIIDFSNYAIFSVGSHLLMLTVIRWRWKLMIQGIQCWRFAFNDHTYVIIRRMSCFGVIYIIVLVRFIKKCLQKYVK